MIEVKNLTHKYGNKVILQDINFSIRRGEILGLLGKNGAGKTTIIKILTGLCKQTSGEALINGYNTRENPKETKPFFRVLTQENSINKDLSVYENLRIFSMLYNVKNSNEKIKFLLKNLDLYKFINEKTLNLSGGEQRKLLLARTLMDNPCAIFLDEPSLGLDVDVRKFMWDKILEAKNKNSAILLTTHYIQEAQFLCDKVAILHNGKIITLDSPKNLIENLGKFGCIDFNKNSTTYFHTLKKAKKFSNQNSTIKKTNLEDVFLFLTKSYNE
ncbi:ABC transporter ATP-binding protein [Campylobacter sputorum]|uniref:ABC transporter ATP-binding protein n=1 Tax=Campylobacter sputorum TaxID=206 RepID=UPI00053C073D|nr:ABC transporter ATP-binding protein [Campylobacter sputorum]